MKKPVGKLILAILFLLFGATLANAYVLTGGTPPAPANAQPAAGEPSGDFFAGTYTYSTTDLSLAGPMPINLTRTYRTEYKDGNGNFISGAFGPGFNLNYNMFLYSASEVANQTSWWNNPIEIILPNGSAVSCNNNGSNTSYTLASYSCISHPGPYYGATIEYDSSVSPTNSPGWDVVLRDGTLYQYGLGAPLQAIKDRNGNYVTLTYSSGQSGNLTQINASSGRWIQLTYNSSNEIIQAADSGGRTMTYSYNSTGPPHLIKVYDANSTVIEALTYWATSGPQKYDLYTITLGGANEIILAYNKKYQVTQALGDNGGGWLVLSYSGSPTSTSTTIEDFSQNKTVYNFNSAGYLTSRVAASGTTIAETTTYGRISGTNQVGSIADQLGRTTNIQYDSLGNVSQVTLPLQNQNTQNNNCPSSAPTPVWIYNYTNQPPQHPYPYFTQKFANANPPQQFEVLQSITDPNNNVPYQATVFDSYANPKTIKDGNGKAWTYTYNSAGQVTTASDPILTPDVFSFQYYASGDPESVTDPNQNQWTIVTDYTGISGIGPGIGNITSVTSPLNEVESYTYDGDLRLKTSQDAAGKQAGTTMTYGYNANSQVTSIQDENGYKTTFSYPDDSYSYGTVCNAWDDIYHCWQYNYDTTGRLAGITDPNGKTEYYTFDSLNRVTETDYNSSSNYTKYTYDLGNRATQTVDSVAGTTNRSYDNLDDLMVEAASSTVGYCYDPGQRRTSATMGAQSLSYSYDAADNLISVSQGAGNQGAQLAYDAAERRIATFMPNNAWEYYFYDAASNIQWIEEYNNGSSTGQYLNYTYDADERRTMANGPLASVTLPTPMIASYGKGNQMLKFNSTLQNIFYDQDGNMTNDPSEGIGSLTYNARNQLASASVGPRGGPYTAVYDFTYDDLGRRLSQNLSSSIQSYVYDGDDVAFATGSGAYSSYAVFEGLGLDDFFSIAINGNTLGSGGQAVLHDGLGSTMGTETSSGISGTYQYGPFGSTSVGSGSPAAGPVQYTGRELDPTGLYFMRARYYSPGLQRFVSPDPVGFSGGDANLYAYVGNNPVNLTDPTGLYFGDGGDGITIDIPIIPFFPFIPYQLLSQSDPAQSSDSPSQRGTCLPNVGAFVEAHFDEAESIAAQLPNGVTAQEVLAVSGNESSYGRSPITQGNYFGIHGKHVAGQIGTYYTTDNQTPVPKFPASSGFRLSGRAFVSREYGPLSKVNASEPETFFSAIHENGYGTGKSGYVRYMMLNKSTKRGPYALVGACIGN